MKEIDKEVCPHCLLRGLYQLVNTERKEDKYPPTKALRLKTSSFFYVIEKE